MFRKHVVTMKTLTLLLFFLIVKVNTLNILCVFPFPGESHFKVFEPLAKELAKRGHQITVISHFPQSSKVENYEDVSLKTTSIPQTSKYNDISSFSQTMYGRYYEFFNIVGLGQLTCETDLPKLSNFLKEDRHFDLILIEYFNNDCFLGVVNKFKVPFVGILSTSMLIWLDSKVANSANPSSVANHLMLSSDKMTFFERVENTVAKTLSDALYQYYYVHFGNQRAAEKVFGSDLPSLLDISRNVSLLLVNFHFSMGKSRPSVPGLVEIGGIHIQPSKQLPQHLEKWINESTHGVIYFSLGSMIKGHTFPEEKRQMFLRAFARFPQRILWKWETDTMPGKPENVMIDKWMPQFDILSHPNVKAFIAHGGLLGVTEAVHCGVPLIIMPQFGDQFTNAKAVEASGGGVILDYRSLDEESIYNALKTVLDPSFNKKAKELSARFRDRPMPPLETAIYWVEYVARHGGAPHLRTAAVGMPLYQYLLLDVIAFLAVVLLTIMYISFIVTRAIFRRIFKTNKVEKVKKN